MVSAHFDIAPQFAPGPPTPPSATRHSFIEPDRSSRIRMSGATFIAVLLRAPQLASRFGPVLSLPPSRMMIGIEPPLPPRPPMLPPAPPVPVALPPAPPACDPP